MVSNSITIPSEYNSLRASEALETIVNNLDKFPIEELEELIQRNGLINWQTKKD